MIKKLMELTYKLQVAFCEVRLHRGNNPNTTNAANGHFAHLKKNGLVGIKLAVAN